MTGRAVVIGAGSNELVAAHVLARAGWQVIALESRACQEPDVGWVPPQIVRGLDLERHGLKIWQPDPWLAVPVAGGGRLELSSDLNRSCESIRRVSPDDAKRWPEFSERMATLARALEALSMAPPPDPMADGLGALAEGAALALRLRWMGKRAIEDLLRIAPMPVADLLDDWFETDALKGALGAAGVLHLHQGPRAGGTALNLLHNQAGCPPGVFRLGLSNLRQVLSGLPGIEIRRGAEAARITVREGRATGVALADGEEIPASLVLSGVDPRRTLLGLVEPDWLDPEFACTLRGIRSRGVVAEVVVSLGREPGFSTLAFAPSLDYLERAHDDAKYGRISSEPYFEARAEKASVRVHVQFVPNGHWNSAQRDALGEQIMQMLAMQAPQISGTVIGTSVLLPQDLESQFGWPQGQMHHAEPALDQWLWMRPTPELARYRTPITRLYLCGPAMHPGGWMPGACGYHAAHAALREIRSPL